MKTQINFVPQVLSAKIEPKKQQNWIISYWLDNKQKVILSRFSDPIWDLTPYYHRTMRIDFRSCVFPSGENLTAHKQLYRSVKEYIYMLLSSGLGIRTIAGQFDTMKSLLFWMVTKKQFTQFHQITDARAFIPFVRMYVSRGPNNITFNANISKRTLAGRLQTLDNLWRHRSKLRDTLLQPPWPQQTAGSIAGRENYDQPKTLAIPDEAFRQLLLQALAYVNGNATQVIAAFQAALDARTTTHSLRWGTRRATEAVRQLDFKGLDDLRHAFVKLRTCCYVILAGFVGPRNSEALSVEENCIERKTMTIDGENYPLILIHGITYKGKKDKKGQRVSWLANEEVAQAMTTLEKLVSPYRAMLKAEIESLETIPTSKRTPAQVQQLQDARRSEHKLFLGYKSPIRCNSKTVINHDLKQLCREFNIVDEFKRPWKCHSHQFRRTLARFVARSKLGDPKYLQQHFKHWSSQLTWYYMHGDVDKELINFMDDEYTHRQ